MRTLALLVLLTACSRPDATDGADGSADGASDPPVETDAPADPPADTDTPPPHTADSAAADTDRPALHGIVPPTPVPLPADFVATAHTGARRGPADLLGQPTVLWFFPRSDTAG